jgi:hypothetical protein
MPAAAAAPLELGMVVAERRFKLRPNRRKALAVTIRVGRPSRPDRAPAREPWWCPVVILGVGDEGVRRIYGEDSLQALILALTYATRRVMGWAEKLRATMDWIDEDRDPVFLHARTQSHESAAIDHLIRGIVRAVAALESGRDLTAKQAGTAAKLLRSCVRETGFENVPWLDAPKPELPLRPPLSLPPKVSRRLRAGPAAGLPGSRRGPLKSRLAKPHK